MLADQVDCVQEYMKFVFKKGIELYGPTYPAINVHRLLHLVDDYEVISSSAFIFESFLGRMKNLVRFCFQFKIV